MTPSGRHRQAGDEPIDPRPLTRAPVLPDVLRPGLAVVFCGSAAGAVSARVGAYYAGPGNRFWRTLHDVGLTPEPLSPQEFRRLPAFGIGLTDMAKHDSGADSDLPRAGDDPDGLRRRIEACAPRILAFNGKRAARVAFRAWFGDANPAYGPQDRRLGPTALFVLPSTSGLAARYWSIEPWRALARAAESV